METMTIVGGIMRCLPALIALLLSSSTHAFDTTYAAYARLLRAYVCDGGVAYDALKKDPGAMRDADALFASLGENEYRRLPPPQRIAYLANLYNYVTIRVIVSNLPLRTGIRDIKDVWKTPSVPLFGRMVSLDHVEHDLLRAQFAEPRIHFALVCASKGCPALPPFPFRGDSLDAQLDACARAFLGDPRRNRVDEKERVIYLSRIFDWYGADFRTKHGGFVPYVQGVLGLRGRYAVRYLEYDWSLNRVESCR